MSQVQMTGSHTIRHLCNLLVLAGLGYLAIGEMGAFVGACVGLILNAINGVREAIMNRDDGPPGHTPPHLTH
jgi:hypothetical protein